MWKIVLTKVCKQIPVLAWFVLRIGMRRKGKRRYGVGCGDVPWLGTNPDTLSAPRID